MALRRSEAIEVLAAGRKPQRVISVTTMQTVTPWHEVGEATTDHLDAMQCMGSASSLGLGIAVARPDRKVMVLDGDGSLLMQLASLVTVAGLAAANYYHFVFENGVYETSGNQKLPGLGKFDFCNLALSAGYRHARSIATRDELERALPEIFALDGPALIRLEIEREYEPIRWPKVRMADEVEALRKALAEDRAASRPGSGP
jgi:phosphonopyruvate decarboxylase